jgi:hypothetical protein
MRYPRAFFIFEEDQSGLNEDFFQSISNSVRKIYLSKISRPCKSIDRQIEKIIDIDRYLRSSPHIDRQVLVISDPKVFDFLITYFSDKNLTLYWLDRKSDLFDIIPLLRTLDQIQAMKHIFSQACHHYFIALDEFIACTGRGPHPQDELIYKINALSYGDPKTILESEARVLLKSKLSMGVMNRIDLS